MRIAPSKFGADLKVSEQFKNQHVESLKSYLPREVGQHPDFQNFVLANINGLVELSSLEVCESRRNRLHLSCEPRDLAERTLTLANGDQFIAGARFKNLDIDFPFIEVLFGTAVQPEQLDEVSKIVRREFKNLSPLGFKFKDRPDIHSDLERWSHTVFGEIKSQPNHDSPLALRFSFDQTIDWYPQYVSEYRELLADKTSSKVSFASEPSVSSKSQPPTALSWSQEMSMASAASSPASIAHSTDCPQST